MIFIALVVFVLLDLAPRLIFRKEKEKLNENFSWKNPLFKLSGIALSLLLAFVLTYWVTISTNDRYIENENAIYGFEFSKEMKNLGFQDSMKVISINGERIDRVSEIIKNILLESGSVLVQVERDGIKKEIVISDDDKFSLMNNPKTNLITPIMSDSSNKNEILITEDSYGFYDAINKFGLIWEQAIIFINPNPSENKRKGAFVTLFKMDNIRDYLIYFALNLIIITILNFLPIPGFSVGNFIISVIEKSRNKYYSKKRLRMLKWISIIIVIIALTI